MGVCWCKEKQEDSDFYFFPPQTDNQHTNTTTTQSNPSNVQPEHYPEAPKLCPDPATVDRLVLETLSVIGTFVDNEQEPPPAMLHLHNIADDEDGWIQVVKSMVNVIPMSDPLGPSVITLLLDDCPLPSRNSVMQVVRLFSLSAQSAILGRSTPSRERNICVVLGCIAEKLAGPSNLGILNNETLDYLITNLQTETDLHVILFSLIALEKFAQTSEYKGIIIKRLQAENPSPVNKLESWVNSKHYVQRQVGFCAQWALDNIFVMENRVYSFIPIDVTHINAMLNTYDVSEYLKISPDGLEARCDAYSFESVRCTAQADSGIWYYEVLIITPGVMQIGWATRNSRFLNHDGYGIGDDKYSLAYDGCRKLIWYNAKSEQQQVQEWKAGDILGCLLDLDSEQIVFSLNGVNLPPCTHVFMMAKTGFFAAASFMSFQQCRFNFGSEPFSYAPENVQFLTFNDRATLDETNKVVLPRHIYLNLLRRESVREDSCTLCYDNRASTRLIPCEHSGFCKSCANQLTECPMCRAPFELIEDYP